MIELLTTPKGIYLLFIYGLIQITIGIAIIIFYKDLNSIMIVLLGILLGLSCMITTSFIDNFFNVSSSTEVSIRLAEIIFIPIFLLLIYQLKVITLRELKKD